MNRRQAMQSALAASLAGTAGVPHAAVDREAAAAGRELEPVKPRRLKQGDTIGLVAPASNAMENEEIRFAIDIVESLGFRVREGRHLFRREHYLAGSDAERADDVNRMFADADVDGIFCLRGGYGTPRILPFLDYDTVRRNPKVLLGYSDITALLVALQVKTGLVGFHGPIAGQLFTDYTLQEFRKILTDGAGPVRIGAAPEFQAGPGKVEQDNRVTRFVGGKARGRLTGGNLTLLATLVGTPYEPDFRDRIVFIEDVGEAPYRIDRMLTQLWLAGKLQQCAGIAFGKFTESDDYVGNTFSIEELIRLRCEPLGVPTVRGLMIGHVEDQTVVPIGVMAELDADAGTLRTLEPAVL